MLCTRVLKPSLHLTLTMCMFQIACCTYEYSYNPNAGLLKLVGSYVWLLYYKKYVQEVYLGHLFKLDPLFCQQVSHNGLISLQ